MKKNILLRTNALVCLVILVGFLLAALFSYQADLRTARRNIEQVSTLTSEGIYHQITATFTKPVNISLTMANDVFLRAMLRQEPDRMEDEGYIAEIREYLNGYRLKYGYDAIFLVSDASGRYYNFDGLDRVLTPDNPENVWYDKLKAHQGDYNLVVDNDEVSGAENEITVFVNCKIIDTDGTWLGAVGVGLRINHLQSILKEYQDAFALDTYLTDAAGTIEISAEHTGYHPVRLQTLEDIDDATCEQVLSWKKTGVSQGFWEGGGWESYIVTRYIPEVNWHLVVRQNSAATLQTLRQQLQISLLVILVLSLFLLLIITRVIRRFNRQIVELTLTMEQEQRTMFQRASEDVFETVHEIDITNDGPANQTTARHFESLGMAPGASYTQALHAAAEQLIHVEFRQGYIDTFSPASVRKALEEGRERLVYEARTADGAGGYYWTRITGRIVHWGEKGALHLLTYRQNIDAEKRQERRMQRLAQTDEMTGLYTKSAARRETERTLREHPDQVYAMFLMDIDDFKQANDNHGHAFGDAAIVAFARTLRASFRPTDLLGRVGGDEFVALIPVPDRAWAERKAAELAAALDQVHTVEGVTWRMTASIGVALTCDHGRDREVLYRQADAALYRAKAQGKNGYAIL